MQLLMLRRPPLEYDCAGGEAAILQSQQLHHHNDEKAGISPQYKITAAPPGATLMIIAPDHVPTVITTSAGMARIASRILPAVLP